MCLKKKNVSFIFILFFVEIDNVDNVFVIFVFKVFLVLGKILLFIFLEKFGNENEVLW